MNTALYGQDSYSVGRLTVIGGIRWERIEGYLPAQTTPDSRFFPDGLVFQASPSTASCRTTRSARRSTTCGRIRSGTTARRGQRHLRLVGHGKTVIKASWGSYLDQINTGTPPNPNANINQVYAWNDLNGDFNFQPGNAAWDGLQYVGGEFGALSSTNGLAVAVFDKTLRRPKRDEITRQLDHELFRNVLSTSPASCARERDPQGTIDTNIDQWPALFTPITLTDPGRDGVLDTGDDQPIRVYNQNRRRHLADQRSTTIASRQRYNGLDIIASSAASPRAGRSWRATRISQTQVDLTSLSTPNNAFVNAGGEAAAGATTSRRADRTTCPTGHGLRLDFRLHSGLPITRTWAIPSCSGDRLRPTAFGGVAPRSTPSRAAAN